MALTRDQDVIKNNKAILMIGSSILLLPSVPMLALLIEGLSKNGRNFPNFVGAKGFYTAGVVMCSIGLVLGLILGLVYLVIKSTAKSAAETAQNQYLLKDALPKYLKIIVATVIFSVLGLILFPSVLKNNKWSIQVLNASTMLGTLAFIGFIAFLIYSIVDLVRFDKKCRIENENLPARRPFVSDIENPRVESVRPEEWTKADVEKRLEGVKRFNERLEGVTRFNEGTEIEPGVYFKTFEKLTGELNASGIIVTDNQAFIGNDISYRNQDLNATTIRLGSAFYNAERKECYIATKYGMRMFDIEGDTYTDAEGKAKAKEFTDHIDRILGVSRVID